MPALPERQLVYGQRIQFGQDAGNARRVPGLRAGFQDRTRVLYRRFMDQFPAGDPSHGRGFGGVAGLLQNAAGMVPTDPLGRITDFAAPDYEIGALDMDTHFCAL